MNDPAPKTLLTVVDIARLIDRDRSVVVRYRKAARLHFPAPDYETGTGTSLWAPSTIEQWLATHRPDMHTEFLRRTAAEGIRS